MKGNDSTNSLFYKMEDGSVIREFDVVSDYYSTDYTERKFEILLPDFTEPIPFYLDKHKTLKLSDDLSFVNHELNRITGLVIARYVLPIEDMYIIFEGKDFDGEEASRLAAGGFLLLDVVQAGKVFKFVKGFKTVKATALGTEVATSQLRKRVLKSTIKDVSKEAIINMSCQFVVNLMKDCIEHPEYTDEELFLSAFSKIDIRNAVLEGAISSIAFSTSEQNAYICALDLFKSISNGKEVNSETIKTGVFDCVIDAAITIVFRYGAKTDYMQGLFKQFNDEAKQHIIFSRFKNFTGENCYKLLETFLKKSLN